MSGIYLLLWVLMIYDFMCTNLHKDFYFNKCHSFRFFSHLSFLLFLGSHLETISVASALKFSFPNSTILPLRSCQKEQECVCSLAQAGRKYIAPVNAASPVECDMVKSKCMLLHEDVQPKPIGGRNPLNLASR